MPFMHRNRWELSIIAIALLICPILVTPAQAEYNPKTGKFLQRDPNQTGVFISAALVHNAESQTIIAELAAGDQYADGLNLFQYQRSNPLRGNDPSGTMTFLGQTLSAKTKLVVAGALIGAGMGGYRGYHDDRVGFIRGFLAGAIAGSTGGFIAGAAYLSASGLWAIIEAGIVIGAVEEGVYSALAGYELEEIKCNVQMAAAFGGPAGVLGHLATGVLGGIVRAGKRWLRPKIGGSWISVNEAMSARARAYQTQVTGRTGQAYLLNGVKFDGVTDAGALLDSKGLGYATFVENGKFVDWFRGAAKMIKGAKSQIAAAGGIPIQWHVAEAETVGAIRKLFADKDILGIEVIHVPFVQAQP